MNTETVQISFTGKSLLTFAVELTQKFEGELEAKAILTHIGGKDRPFPGDEKTWEELGNDYLEQLFDSSDHWVLDDYLYAKQQAEKIALSRVTVFKYR